MPKFNLFSMIRDKYSSSLHQPQASENILPFQKIRKKLVKNNVTIEKLQIIFNKGKLVQSYFHFYSNKVSKLSNSTNYYFLNKSSGKRYKGGIQTLQICKWDILYFFKNFYDICNLKWPKLEEFSIFKGDLIGFSASLKLGRNYPLKNEAQEKKEPFLRISTLYSYK